jgi:hypothetical protein
VRGEFVQLVVLGCGDLLTTAVDRQQLLRLVIQSHYWRRLLAAQLLLQIEALQWPVSCALPSVCWRAHSVVQYVDQLQLI